MAGAPLGLIFLGPPGTGKGTQAQRLCDKRGLLQLSSGDVLRREVKEGSEIGLKAQQYMQAGTLVPDEVITGVMLAAIDKLPAGSGFVLDGFPRTVPQAQTLESGLKERSLNIQAVIDFQLADSEIISRIVTRRVCSECGMTYNTVFLPPKVADRCDRCNGKVIQRTDDLEDVVTTRLETYRVQTAPLIGYYTERGLLHSVDADTGADAVEETVTSIVSALSPTG